MLAAMNLEQLTVDYIVVDAESEAPVAYFDQMIANIRDPEGYAVWMVPVVIAEVRSARRFESTFANGSQDRVGCGHIFRLRKGPAQPGFLLAGEKREYADSPTPSWR
jgi:hypothetical protein